MPFRAKSVLIVDDCASLRECLLFQLKNLGYTVIEASDGRSAIELLERGFVPDVILSDMRMPQMDGMGLLERVGEQFPLVPFIFLTGYVSDELLLEAMRRGAWDYLEKPFDAAKLSLVLTKALIKAERLKRLLPSA